MRLLNTSSFFSALLFVVSVAFSSNSLAQLAANLSVPATSSSGNYTVTWAGGYQLSLEEQVNGGGWTTVYSGLESSKSFSGKSSASYGYRLRFVFCYYGCTSYYSVVETIAVQNQASPPPIPSSIVVPLTSTDGVIAITWASSSTATKYHLQESKDNGAWVTLTSTTTGTSYTRDDLSSGSYKYRVRAYNVNGWSGYRVSSNVDVILASSGLSVPATSSTGNYTVTWTGGYPISLEERVNGGGWASVYSGSEGSKSFSGKSSGTYEYRTVWGYCYYGCYSYISAVETIVVQRPPSTPSSISVPSSSTNGSIAISWAASNTATHYKLQESKNNGGWTSLGGSISATSYTPPSRSDGSYKYRVQACNAGGCSAYRISSNTIVEFPPSFSINNATSAEGGNLTFTVSKSKTTTQTYAVSYATANNSALSGSDYTAKSGSLSFTGSQTSKTITVATTQDNSVESSETFYVNLSSPTNGASISDSQGLGTISNDDFIPGVPSTITTPSTDNNGAFTVTWGAATGTVTSYKLYQQKNGGSWGAAIYSGTSLSKAISGLGDGSYKYRVQACNASGCSGYRTSSTTSVEFPPSFSINNASVTEGSTLTFTVTKSKVTSQTYAVSYATVNNTALSTSDYTARSGSLSFTGSQTTKTFTVATTHDTNVEENETFYVNLSSPTNGASISDSQGIATINNNDYPSGVPSSLTTPATDNNGAFTVTWGAATGVVTSYKLYQRINSSAWGSPIYSGMNLSHPISGLSDGTYEFGIEACNGTDCSDLITSNTLVEHPPSFSINDATVEEGSVLTFTVSKSKVTSLTYAVSYATVNNTAVSSSDYTATSGTLSFTGAQTSKTFTVATMNDSDIEFLDETFFANLSNPTGSATISDSQGLATILNVVAPAPPVSTSAVNPTNDTLTGSEYLGVLAGKHSVTAGGAFNYILPIEPPPGVNGHTPKLNLSYNSNRKNGLVGWGWSIDGLSTIKRCRASLARDGYVSGINYQDSFKFCLDGQRLVQVGAREYRTENESFSRITSIGGSATAPNSWKVELKNGEEIFYGENYDAKIDDVDGYPVDWFISSRKDISGNEITYQYTKLETEGVHRISTISYGGTTLNNHIYFEYLDREDISEKYIAGVKRSLNQRLSAIEVRANSTRIKKYKLFYQQWDGSSYADPARISRLEQIQLCFDTDNECLPSQVFSWSDAGRAAYTSFNTDILDDEAISTVVDENYFKCIFGVVSKWSKESSGDYNGDGILDRVYFDNSASGAQPYVQYSVSPVNNRFGMSEAECQQISLDRATATNVPLGSAIPDYPSSLQSDNPHWNSAQAYNLFTVDFNQDGVMDLGVADPYMVYGIKVYLGGSNGLTLSNDYSLAGNETSYDVTTQDVGSGGSVRYKNATYRLSFHDFNGDGLPDVFRHKMVCPSWDCNLSGSNITSIDVSLNTGSGYSDFQSWAQVDGDWRSYLAFGDVNGDGLTDVIGYQGQVALSTGSSFVFGANWPVINGYFEAQDLYEYIPGAGLTQGHYIDKKYIGDFNGDGLADLAHLKTNGIMVRLSTGSGFEAAQLWTSSFKKGDSYETGFDSVKFDVADINGDGLTDIIYSKNFDWTNITPTQGESWSYTNGVDFIAYSKGRFSGLDSFHVVKSKLFVYRPCDDLTTLLLLCWVSPARFDDVNRDGFVDAYQEQKNPHFIESISFDQSTAFNNLELAYKPMGQREIYTQTQNSNQSHALDIANVNVNSSGGFGVGANISPFSDNSVVAGKVGRQYRLASMKAYDGIGGQIQTDYHYHNSLRHLSGFGDLGFEKVEETKQLDSAESVRTVREFLQLVDGTNGYRLVKPKRTQIYHYNSSTNIERLLSDSLFKWEVRVYSDDIDASASAPYSPHIFPYMKSKSVSRNDLDGSSLGSTRYYSYAEGAPSCSALTDDLNAVINTSFGSANDDHYSAEGVPFYELNITCGGLAVAEATENINVSSIQTAGRWVLGQIETVKKHVWTGYASSFIGAGDEVRTSAFTYDSLGRVKSTTREPAGDDTQKLVTEYTYNAYGSIDSIIESVNSNAAGAFTSKTTHIDESYLNAQRSVVTVDSLGFISSATYSADYGLPILEN